MIVTKLAVLMASCCAILIPNADALAPHILQRPTSSRQSWSYSSPPKLRQRNKSGLVVPSAQAEPSPSPSPNNTAIIQDYLSLLRPITLIQAVGAWLVGRLLGTPNFLGDPREWCAMLVIYLSYGVGMVANDCADAALDQQGSNKKANRAIASGRISVQQGWIFVAMLSAMSLGIAFGMVSTMFGWWCAFNLFLMLVYAGGLQNILLVKNILVGWLCISPLWGATTMNHPAATKTSAAQALFKTKMSLLATAGFSLGVIREILKDIQDMELDRGTKFTLPIWIGERAAQRISFAALGATLVVLQTPMYRRLFAASSTFPLYSTTWLIASVMCARASLLPTIGKQQCGVKQSIYVLLVGIIGSMMMGK